MPVMNDYEAKLAVIAFLDAWEKQLGNIERVLL